MTFKKGDRIQTEEGHAGEILFVDKDGLEAQVALEHVSMKIRTDTLRRFELQNVLAPATSRGDAPARGAKKRQVPRTQRR